MVINWLKKNWLHFAIIALLAIVASIYFAPAFSGKTIEQADVTNWIGSAKEIQDHRNLYEEEPMWSNNSFIGMSSENVSLNYEGNFFNKLRKIITLGLPAPVDFLFMYFLSFYIMMVCFKVKPWVAAIGALAFGFSSYFIIILEAGHNTKAWAIAFMPAVIGGAYLAFRRNLWLGIGVSAIFMTFQLLSNHPQISYYLGMAIGFVFIVELVRSIAKTVKEKSAKPLIRYASAGIGIAVVYVLALGVNYGRISMVQEATNYTTRGPSTLTIGPDLKKKEQAEKGLDKDYITQWSMGVDETFSLVIPYAKGYGSSSLAQEKYKDILKEARKDKETRIVAQNAQSVNMYWGDQPFTSGPVYFGIIMVFLALLAMFYVKTPWKWALFSVTVLTVMLSWGKNFVGVQDYLFAQLAIIFFAAAEYIKHKYVKIGLAALGGLFALLLILMFRTSDTSLTDFFIDNIPLYNKFRAVTMILVVGAMCIPALGVLFLKEVSENKEEIRKNMIPFYVVSGVGLILMIIAMSSPTTFVSLISEQENNLGMAGQIPEQFLDALETFRAGVFKASAQRSLIFLVLAIAIIAIVLLAKKLKPIYVLPVLGLFVVFELVPIDKTFLNNEEEKDLVKLKQWMGADDKRYPLSPNAMDVEILQNEISTDEELAKIVEEAKFQANKNASDFDFGAIVKRPRSKRKPAKGDTLLRYKDNYVWSEQFAALNQNTHYRVLDMTVNFNSNSRTSYFHKSFGGYHGAKPRRYQEMVDFHMTTNINQDILDMANVKYIMNRPAKETPNGSVSTRKTALGNAWLVKDIKFLASEDDEMMKLGTVYELEDLSGSNSLTVNNERTNKATVLGNANVTLGPDAKGEEQPFQVPYDRMIMSPSATSVILGSDSAEADIVLPPMYFQKSTLKNLAPKHLKITKVSEFNPKNEVLVNESFKDNVSKESYAAKGTIELTSYKANELKYKFNSSEPEFAVFSELYHPVGWKATIDGNEVPINRVNYLLRGLEIPAGEHEVVFAYDIPAFHKSTMMSIMFGSIIIIIFAFGIFMTIKKAKKEEAPVVQE